MKSFDSSFFKQMTSKKTDVASEPIVVNQLGEVENQLLAMAKVPKTLGGADDINPEAQDTLVEMESALSAYVEV